MCGLLLSTAKGKKRHKKLHGRGFTSGKATLISCIELYGVTLDAIGLDKPTCVVCYQCTVKLDKILEFQTKMERIRMEILHSLFGIDNNSLSSNDNCQQNSTGTPQSLHATEQLEPVDHVQQNFAGTPRRIQATDQPAAEDNEPHRKRSKVTVCS